MDYSSTAVSVAGRQWQRAAWLGSPSIKDYPKHHITGLLYCQYTNNPVAPFKKGPSIPFSRTVISFTTS